MRNVRVYFSKSGRMKFASHLDMNRLMTRLIRLSKIPVWYTEGFNQHPYITFALPLSLGFTSDYEVMDIRITDDEFSNEKVAASLASVFPEGLNIIKVCDAVNKTGKIAFARFRITFEAKDNTFTESLQSFLNKDSIITTKKTKKGSLKEIDIAPFIKESNIEIAENVVLDIVLPAGGDCNINPTLLLEAYGNLPDYSICRTMIYDDKMECFS